MALFYIRDLMTREKRWDIIKLKMEKWGKGMKYIRIFFLIYCGAGAIACLIHMWRNRKEPEIVRVYAYTFLLELLFVLAFSVH